jgi:hypothetical protein
MDMEAFDKLVSQFVSEQKAYLYEDEVGKVWVARLDGQHVNVALNSHKLAPLARLALGIIKVLPGAELAALQRAVFTHRTTVGGIYPCPQVIARKAVFAYLDQWIDDTLDELDERDSRPNGIWTYKGELLREAYKRGIVAL